ncbi:UNVERIFIED_CONTAM: hypothetical protein Slati_3858200, partial [Sesamum latifolium]
MSMLKQDLPSLPVVTEAMGRFGLSISYNEEDDDPEGDSFLNNECPDSEPDEVEEEDQIDNNHENDDEVSIDIMLDVLEISADSIDVPTGNWGHFCDSNTGELALGMIFKSKDHLKASVQDFSVRFARQEYKVVESNPKLWKSMIATHLLGMVRQDPSYEIKNIRQTIKDKFGFEIPYHKAWQALKTAREQIYGTWESSVQKLPRYMAALQKWNPGIVIEWYHLDADRPGLHMLNYVFWAFRPCIEGFRYCRNVISVDGTHLYTRYKHKLLVAVTLDANNQ